MFCLERIGAFFSNTECERRCRRLQLKPQTNIISCKLSGCPDILLARFTHDFIAQTCLASNERKRRKRKTASHVGSAMNNQCWEQRGCCENDVDLRPFPHIENFHSTSPPYPTPHRLFAARCCWPGLAWFELSPSLPDSPRQLEAQSYSLQYLPQQQHSSFSE